MKIVCLDKTPDLAFSLSMAYENANLLKQPTSSDIRRFGRKVNQTVEKQMRKIQNYLYI